MKTVWAVIVLLQAVCVTIWSQTQRSRFEVASIKPAAPATDGRLYGGMQRDPRRVSYQWVTVQNLLSQAYRVKNVQISGPGWIDGDRFDIVAKVPNEANDDELRAMLQALLEDRFRLSFHTETRNLRAYGLVLAKGGPKGTTVGGPIRDVQTRVNGTQRRFSGKVTMAYLAGLLSNLEDRPVVDSTGLNGVYDVDLEWSDYNSAAPADESNELPTIFTALQKKLGLRFENRTAPVEVYVIDHVEKPLEN